MNGYRPAMLARATERDPRQLFEHWTHDAAIIPLKWYPHCARASPGTGVP